MTSPCHMYITSQRIQELLEAFFMFFKYKKRYLMVSNKIVYYSCEDGKEKCITRDHNCHHSASLVMPNGDLWDGLFYLTLTLMICSYIPEVTTSTRTGSFVLHNPIQTCTIGLTGPQSDSVGILSTCMYSFR